MMAYRPATREEQWDAFTLEMLIEGMGEIGEHGENLNEVTAILP